MNNNGNVIQLNMGLGKTRVILPMLILYYSYQTSSKRMPRLHILSTLLTEVCEHFHTTLGASVLRIKLFTLPFRRDVELDDQRAQSILDLVRYCEIEKGFFVVAPEHRLSLELKVKELHLDGHQQMSESLEMSLAVKRNSSRQGRSKRIWSSVIWKRFVMKSFVIWNS
jgi:hypothetical protein